MAIEKVHGLVALLADRFYMTFAEADPGLSGIKKLDDAFASADQRDSFLTAIKTTTGLAFDDVRGNILVANGNESDAIKEFSTCAFRVEPGGPVFAARFFKDHGAAFSQSYSLFAIVDENDPAIVTHKAGDPIDYNKLLGSKLIPVFASVSITVDRIAGTDGGAASENYGNGGI